MAKVEIFTKRGCPYSEAAKELLTRRGVPFEETVAEDLDATQAMLRKRTGGRDTFPQIFIGGRPVGGSDDLEELDAEGELEQFVRP